MDSSNPAVAQQLPISPAALEALEKDASLITAQARKMFFIQAHKVHQLMAGANVPMGQRLQFMEVLAKAGDVYPKATAVQAGAGGPAFSINIVLNKDDPKPIASSQPVVEVDVEDVTPKDE